MKHSPKNGFRLALCLAALAAFASGCFWYGPGPYRHRCYGCYRHADGYWGR
jgi:hypothetical protein